MSPSRGLNVGRYILGDGKLMIPLIWLETIEKETGDQCCADIMTAASHIAAHHTH